MYIYDDQEHQKQVQEIIRFIWISSN